VVTRAARRLRAWRNAATLAILLVCGAGAQWAHAAANVAFTPEEQAWLATEPVVRYSVDPNLRPLEYVENGKPQGLMVEFLKTIEADTGLRFAFVPAASGADAVRLFNADWIDLLPGLTGQRRLSEPLGDSLRVSPHYSGATIVVGRDSQPVVLEAANLDGLRVAITKGGREADWLETRVPGAIMVARNSPIAALEAVIEGQADVAMGPEVAFLPVMRRAYRGVLSVAGTVSDLPVVLSMRVQPRAVLLQSVLNKALLAQTALETDVIFNRWFDLADFGRPNARALLAYYWREGALVLLLLISLITVAVLSVKARRAARHAAEEKSRFLAVMSHEIRTAMNAVVGPIDVLSHQPDSPDRVRLLATARTGAHVLLDTVNNLLDLSKLRAGKISVAAAAFDIATLVHETLDVFRVPANQKGVLLATDAPRPLMVEVDGGRYRQVLLNLLSNALKFTHSGRIDVALRVEQGPRGALLTTTVSDTGVGIAAADIHRVFEDYEQSGKSAQGQGTGLGLAICREIVTLMGGDIALTSRPGQGTSAIFTIPIVGVGGVLPVAVQASGRAAPLALGQPEAQGLDVATLAATDRHVEAALRDVTPMVGVGVGDVDVETGKLRRDADHDHFPPAEDRTRTALHLADARDAGARREADRLPMKPPPNIYLVPSSHPASGSIDRGTATHTVDAASGPGKIDDVDAVDNAAAVGHHGDVASHTSALGPKLLIDGVRVPHLLVIDDNPVNREVVAAQLGVLGWTFELCDGGDSGLAAWEVGEFDAVLLDCHMPEPDGYEVARRMRLDEGMRGTARTPILALSAHSEPAHVQRCLKSGMDGVMLKPLDVVLLQDTLALWLESVAEALADEASEKAPAETGDSRQDTAVDQRIEKQGVGQDEVDQAGGRRDAAALIALFVQTCDEDMSGLRAAFESRDRKGVFAHSHRIKGASFSMGFSKSADAALAIEVATSEAKAPVVWSTVGRGIDTLAAALTIEVNRTPP